MAINNERAALLIIDMQNGFIQKESSFCIAGAEATLPQCAKTLAHARELGIPVYYVRRDYAPDGSDIEASRYASWVAGGRPISTGSALSGSLDFPDIIKPQATDRIVTKPRFSAFHNTALSEELHARSINTVILIGTTTPNCVRATCYDALSLNFNVVIIEDCTSSRSPEVQAANIADMAFVGAQVIDTATFCASSLTQLQDFETEHQQAISML